METASLMKDRQFTSLGKSIPPNRMGHLKPTVGSLDNAQALRDALQDIGYLYLPGFFDVQDIFEARMSILRQLKEMRLIDESEPLEKAVYSPIDDFLAPRESMISELDLEGVEKVIYSDRAKSFFSLLFGEACRHYDFTWFRSVRPGANATAPHCDIVYMGRGTFDVLTMWTPYGDVRMEDGGLMILEGSHKKNDRFRKYLETDVDTYCSNDPDRDERRKGRKPYLGFLSENPDSLCARLGGRWLSADYKMGDVVIFGMGLVHGSLDGQGRSFRLSSDCRYQRASEAIDERWVGEDIVVHDPRYRKGKIC